MKQKIGFLIHLLVYIVVITLLAVINYSTSTDYIWFKWPLIGWGIAVIIHALSVFSSFGKSSLKERMIEDEMKKEAQKKQEQNN